MTTVPRRVGRQVTGGLVAIIAAFSVALAGESSASAAAYTNSTHQPRVAGKRDIRHERLLRDIRNPPDAKRRRTRPTARKAPRDAGTWTVSAPSVGLAADLMTLSGPSGTFRIPAAAAEHVLLNQGTWTWTSALVPLFAQ